MYLFQGSCQLFFKIFTSIFSKPCDPQLLWTLKLKTVKIEHSPLPLAFELVSAVCRLRHMAQINITAQNAQYIATCHTNHECLYILYHLSKNQPKAVLKDSKLRLGVLPSEDQHDLSREAASANPQLPKVTMPGNVWIFRFRSTDQPMGNTYAQPAFIV